MEDHFILDEGLIAEEIYFSEREDLISNEELISLASFSRNKVIIQKQGYKYALVAD